jgi:hypothetical protein
MKLFRSLVIYILLYDCRNHQESPVLWDEMYQTDACDLLVRQRNQRFCVGPDNITASPQAPLLTTVNRRKMSWFHGLDTSQATIWCPREWTTGHLKAEGSQMLDGQHQEMDRDGQPNTHTSDWRQDRMATVGCKIVPHISSTPVSDNRMRKNIKIPLT